MGTEVRVVVIGGPPHLAELARQRIHSLEARWSRFEPRSEISQLNRAPGGRPTIVSLDTYRLVETAVAAWHRTGGRFDPTVLAAMLANGYDRTFDELPADRPSPALPAATLGCAGIVLDPLLHAVTLPAGVGIDPGGIGKGLAADMVATELSSLGAQGALIDIGGDIRVVGQGPCDGAWVVEIEDPDDADHTLLRVALTDAAIATSSTRRRRWSVDGEQHHHLVDPATGRCPAGPLVSATVIAAEGWWAEALTKAVLVAGDLTPLSDASGLSVDTDGRTRMTPDLEVLAA